MKSKLLFLSCGTNRLKPFYFNVQKWGEQGEQLSYQHRDGDTTINIFVP